MNFLPTSLKGALLASTVVAVPSMALAQEGAPDDFEEIVVQGQYIPDEKRNTSEISNVLDAEAFERTGDGDIAVALARVTGLSVVGGKYVFVRGLGERYSSTTLDGSQIPSPVPLRRAVPLDIFPTGLLSEVLVQKTFSPEFGLDFAGGVINLRTVAVPDEYFFKFGVSAGLNTVSTFDQGLNYDAPDVEVTTYGGAGRNIPQGLIDAIQTTSDPNNAFADLDSAQLEQLGESLPNRWSLDAEGNMPNQSYSISMGDKFDVGEGRLGFIASLDYGFSAANKFGLRREFTVSDAGLVLNEDLSPTACENVPGATGVPFISDDCGFFQTEQEFSLNGIFSVGYEIDPANIVKATSVVLRQSTKTGLIQKGSFAADPGTVRTFTRSDWIERQVWFNQISGEHEWSLFGDSDTFFDTIVNWRANYSRTDRDAPLRREFTYDFNDVLGVDLLSARPDGNRTSYSALDDESWEFGFDIIQPMSLGDYAVDLKFGYTYFDKDRGFAVRRFGFDFPPGANLALRQLVPEQVFTAANIGPGGFELVDFSDASDASVTGLDMQQAYVGFDIQLTERLRLAHGWRYEESNQFSETLFRSDTTLSAAQLSQIDNLIINAGQPTAGGGVFFDSGTPLTVRQKLERFYPSATLTYEFAENMQVRGGYSKTLNRPDLRELSLARFVDPETQLTIQGNPFLQASTIDNFDLRFEWYFGLGESFTVGTFYKEFANPIEQSFIFIGEQPQLTYFNSAEAELYGVEAEIEKTLDLQDWFGWEWLGDRIPFIKANGSFIDSTVTIRAEGAGANGNVATSDSRALQGQSKWLANIQIGFDDFNRGEQFVVALNYTGKRIFIVGVAGAPDVVERPPLLLKVVYKREFEAFGTPLKFTLEADNLLDDDLRRFQGSELYRQYDIGQTYTVGISYDF